MRGAVDDLALDGGVAGDEPFVFQALDEGVQLEVARAYVGRGLALTFVISRPGKSVHEYLLYAHAGIGKAVIIAEVVRLTFSRTEGELDKGVPVPEFEWRCVCLAPTEFDQLARPPMKK